MRDLQVYYDEISERYGYADFILAIDEHGSPSYPRSKNASEADFYFFLTGVLSSTPLALKHIVMEINHIKNEWFGSAGFVLHGTEMTSRRGKYWRLKELERRKMFYQQLFGMIATFDIEVYVVGMDKRYIYSKYAQPIDLYHAGVQMLTERILYKHQDIRKVVIWFENRGQKEDERLKNAIIRLREEGFADPLLPRYIPEKLKSIHWIYWGSNKSENIAVLQLADIVAHFYGRFLRMRCFERRNEDTIRQKTPEIIWFKKLMDHFKSSGRLVEAFIPSNIKCRPP